MDAIATHNEALQKIAGFLLDPQGGSIKNVVPTNEELEMAKQVFELVS